MRTRIPPSKSCGCHDYSAPHVACPHGLSSISLASAFGVATTSATTESVPQRATIYATNVRIALRTGSRFANTSCTFGWQRWYWEMLSWQTFGVRRLVITLFANQRGCQQVIGP